MACTQPQQKLGNSTYRSFSTAASSCSRGLGFAPRRREYVRSTTCSHLKQPREGESEKTTGKGDGGQGRGRLRLKAPLSSILHHPFRSDHLCFFQPTPHWAGDERSDQMKPR